MDKSSVAGVFEFGKEATLVVFCGVQSTPFKFKLNVC